MNKIVNFPDRKTLESMRAKKIGIDYKGTTKNPIDLKKVKTQKRTELYLKFLKEELVAKTTKRIQDRKKILKFPAL